MNTTKKKISSESLDDENLLQNHFDKIQNTLNSAYDHIDDIIFKLSAGGLTISFPVLSFLEARGQLHSEWIILIIWGLFALCLIGISISHIISRDTAKRSQEVIRQMINNGEKYDSKIIDEQARSSQKPLRWINNICFWVLMANILLTISYTFMNFYH